MIEAEREYIQCFITHLEQFGHFLKVWFQRDNEASLLVENHLSDITEELQFGPYSPKKFDDLAAGLICFGKFEDGRFYRVKIKACSKSDVNVLFIDYGNEATLNISDIRVNNQNNAFRELLCVTPLATSAYLQGLIIDRPLSDGQLNCIKNHILYSTKICSLKLPSPLIPLIDVTIDKKYLSETLIDSGIGKSITDAELVSRVQKMNPMYQDSPRSCGRSLVSHRLMVRNKTAQPEIPNQKSQFHLDESSKQFSKTNSLSLPLGSTHNAYITHIEDGPFSFSVQLKSHSEETQPKIDALCNRNPPLPNSAPLLPGSNILGRSRLDCKFRRAVVMNVKATSCKVYYMDYGTTEELPQTEIYTLPPMILEMAQPQAMGFCLADLQSANLPESCKDIFSKLVLNKQVLLRVTQNELGSLTQCCEMFLDGKNVREMLINIASPLEYTNQFPPRGREIPVNVSFVDCPTQFYVQYHSEIHILGMIQDSLSAFCPNQERLQSLTQISIGSPIGSLYSIDNMWYRALVIGIDDDTVNVLYVDYGNRDNVRVDQLCNLSRELVTKWRSQAVECCLVGFENATPDPLLAEEMESKVLGEHFILKLQYLLNGNRLVVDLLDDNDTSVVKMMNDFAKRIGSTTGDHSTPSQSSYHSNQLPKFPSISSSFPSQSTSYQPYEVDHGRGSGGDGGGDSGGGGRFGGSGSGRSNAADTKSYQRQYNKHSEHDDRFVEDYEGTGPRAGSSVGAGSGSDRFKKKWEDRNGGAKWREEGSTGWRDESRRNDDTAERGYRFSSGGSDNWEDKKSKDRSSRGDRSGGDRNNRYSGGGERSGRFNDGRRSGKWNDNNEDEKFSERNEKFKGSGGDRRNRYGEGSGGGGERGGASRFSNRDEDEEKSSEHGSAGEKYGSGSGRFSGGDRGNRGGGRKFSGDYDNKFADRKFGDKGGRYGGGDKSNRNRDQGDRGSGGTRRNNEKRSFDNSSKARDSPKAHYTPVNETIDDWDVDKTSSSSTTQLACSVREYPNLNIAAGETYSVYFSVMGNEPTDIYVQMDGSLALLDELREQIDAEEALLTTSNNRSVPKELLTPGLPVLARFSDDGMLYRAIVRSHTAGMVTVLFVDFGNYSQVALSDLYTVSPELATKPIQALRVMLTDIKPSSEKWNIDQSIYIPYFDTDVLTLKVNILKCIDGEIVTIGSMTRTDGKTVSQKLIEDGLALSANESVSISSATPSGKSAAQEPVPAISDEWRDKLDHLVGQKFYADIVAVVDTNTLSLRICAANRIIEGRLDDDRTISDLSSHTKVIVNLTGIEDQRLLVSIYDCSGKKLGESDSGSSTISPICPMPVVKKTELVYISHYSDKTVFIQCASSSNDLAVLLDRLFEHYSTSEPDESTLWEVGMLCCVISEDGNWYRAKIINNDNNYKVMFIDYGNTETVGIQQLRQLHSDFYTAELSLGVQLSLEWTVEDPPLMKYVENEEFECLFNRDEQGSWVVDLTFVSNGEKLVKKLAKEGIAKEKEQTVEVFVEEKPGAVDSKHIPEGPPFEIGASLPILVSHVDTPTMFWVQLCSNLNFIEDLQQKLQDGIENMPSPSEGAKVFAAKYTEDNIWYRAIATGDGDSVRFIDYGNTDLAPSRKQLPDDLLNPEEGYAIPMYLRVQPDSGNWSEEAIKLFEAFIEQQITAEVVRVGKKILVDLKSNDQYLSKLLVDGKHGSYIDDVINEEKTTPTVYEVLVLGVTDVNDFYIQMVSDADKQVEMMDYLSDAENFERIDSCNVGEIVAAKYPFDEQWYRAKIICLDPLHALFIDYGTHSEINECRQLPENLKMEPFMAVHCSLNLESSHIMTEQFAIMINDATRVFKLNFKTKGDPNIVELQMENGENVSEFLSGTFVSETPAEVENSVNQVENSINQEENVTPGNILKNCVVCHANGPYDFYIHTPSSQGLAQDLIDKMEDAVNFPKVEKLEKGDVIAVLSSEDEVWYRCKVVDIEPEVGGYFIDYGNGTLVTDYRALPDEIKAIPELAIKCSLHLPDGIGGWSAEAVLTFTELVNDNVQGFDVLVIAEGDPWVVELITNNTAQTKVTEELLKLCPAATPVPSKPVTRTASPVLQEGEHISIPQENPISETSPATITTVSTPVSWKCYVTHVNSPKDFFIRDSNTCVNLEKVALALSELETKPKEEPYNIGDLAIAQIEGEFSRAKIIEVNPLKVSLIDVGNTSETSNLLEVPDSIRNIPPTAINCSLYIPIEHSALSKKAQEEFSTITLSGNVEFNYRILSDEGSRPEIELSLNSENIIDILNENLSKKARTKDDKSTTEFTVTEQVIKSGMPFKVTIPSVSSLKHFYIQKFCPEIDLIASKLLKADTFETPASLNVGDLVAACCLEDCTWYRSKIVKLDPFEVIFIDYGNTSVVEDVRKLPEELSKLPFKATLAELAMPEGITEWNPEAETKFFIICEATFEFDCTVISQENRMPCIVKLSVPAIGDISSALAFDSSGDDPLPSVHEKRTSSEEDDVETAPEEIIGSIPQELEGTFKQEEEENFFEAKESPSKESGDVSEISKKERESISEVKPEEEENIKKAQEQEQERESTDNNLDHDESLNITIDDQISSQLDTSVECCADETLVSEPTILESEESLDRSTKDESMISQPSSKESRKVERTPLRVKSVAEIKANAKPRIQTRSTSATPLKSGRNTSSPVHKSKTADAKKKTEPQTQMRRSVSFEDKIIPGCVSGHVGK